MALTTDNVRHIARLARVGLTDADVERYAAQLTVILDHFDALSRVPTDGLEPTAHPLPLYNVMRADEVAPSLPQKVALENAPETEDGYVRVRAVLE
ncbi:MAG: Asp-tRNA(Asn)/Glu-tRNA(Gln) amidotransferase subunit GatC [Dehalococcoidia bacterium]